MNNPEIKKGKWYKIVLNNGEKYKGECTRERFLDEIKLIYNVEMSVCNNNKRGDFSDFTIPTGEIKSTKQLTTKRIVGNKIWEIKVCPKEFDVVCYNKSDADIIAKELISSKKRVKTFDDIEKASRFLEQLSNKK